MAGRRLTVDTKARCIGDTIAKDKDGAGFTTKKHPAAALQTPGMVLSVWGTATADDDRFGPYFEQKGFNFDGEFRGMNHRIGVMSHRGFKPDSPNQDDFFVLVRPESILLGVMDGHGPDGHTLSHFAQEHLPTKITEHLREDGEAWEQAVSTAVEEICQKAKDELGQKARGSGSTVTVTMLDRQGGRRNSSALSPRSQGEESATASSFTGEAMCRRPWRLRTAYLGDSIAVHAKRAGKGRPWDITVLTDIHRPDRPDEQARIVAAGGEVLAAGAAGAGSPPRLVTPEWNIAMSRSFADFQCVKFGLSNQPEFGPERELDSESEHLILVCSDGVWDVMPPPQAVAFVGKFKPEEAQLAVERLVSKAQLRWQENDDVVDDITAILLWPAFEEHEVVKAA